MKAVVESKLISPFTANCLHSSHSSALSTSFEDLNYQILIVDDNLDGCKLVYNILDSIVVVLNHFSRFHSKLSKFLSKFKFRGNYNPILNIAIPTFQSHSLCSVDQALVPSESFSPPANTGLDSRPHTISQQPSYCKTNIMSYLQLVQLDDNNFSMFNMFPGDISGCLSWGFS
ncbi:hypothetical protein RUND412_004344 [Rhizina undulata]